LPSRGRLGPEQQPRAEERYRAELARDRIQTSLNLALGSALASIGLTIPVVAVVAIAMGQRLELGLVTLEQVLLALTLFIGVVTLGTGRTTVLQGIVHLVLFAAYLFLAFVP